VVASIGGRQAENIKGLASQKLTAQVDFKELIREAVREGNQITVK